ncbi:1,4-alpha-glucan branching protein GlgB [Tianweitania sp. BSSL-BM11]|uniref:1,4-alpha-glucan branching enzyme GlgB n=1 Tax=Tianweitania aestuarii TaxID=2814886 RepID=A0ABS5RQG7_9HYPH|nr:1,4-alpha-glucan branching protein GlgB [Tianweitania aestuarii]MBS9719286.1 1,4-alpha-glucan branching protein GlgB [Tianweitania aestuarii]
MSEKQSAYASDIEAIVRGRHGNVFAVLGLQTGDNQPVAINVFAPYAATVSVIDENDAVVAELEKIHREGFFSSFIEGKTERFPYRLKMTAGEHEWIQEDPYRFPAVLGELDEYLLGEGRHLEFYNRLGAHPTTIDGVEGTVFAVWAPNARRVSVVGDFNAWDGRRLPMRKRWGVGVWELFVPGVGKGSVYKYEILGVHGELLPLKADPVGFYAELPPKTASVVSGAMEHDWRDNTWMQTRAEAQATNKPISVYELHLASWRKTGDDEVLDYDTIADLLVPYVTDMGFTHVEFMPVTEHPFSGSWGYQPVGLFAPTSRFGSPEGFARLVDRLHQAEIGVITDWVPAHFPSDQHGLARFDGTALYEHEDPRLGFHKDWNTLIYNFGRLEVSNFLQASALYWIDRFHVDALRVDAVASMLYLDYSRNADEWIPNRFGGRENLDAVDFLKQTNQRIGERFPGAITIAEESTAWPDVSRPVESGGLGFSYKWNMGWMNDTLRYMEEDPINRKYHHHLMTFGMVYAYSENFVLPLSHDEVVHGKGSLLNKMPGDRWQKFANLRAYLTFMWGHPGKKLIFMGGEIAQEREWNHDHSIDWHLLEDPMHRGVQDLVRELNRVYRDTPALHELDCDPAGFEWIEGGDAENSVFSFIRKGTNDAKPVLVVSNMTPVVRENYQLGVPVGGKWREIFNSDAERFGGSDVLNDWTINAEEAGRHGRPASLSLTIPPLATIFLSPE